MTGNLDFQDAPAANPHAQVDRKQAMELARLYPVDRAKAVRGLVRRARKDFAFAEEATYTVRQRVESAFDSEDDEPRYEDVHRPSVRLARPIAQALGHFSYGVIALGRGIQSETLQAWAFDAHTGTYTMSPAEELSLVRKVKRDGRTEYVPLEEQQARAARTRLGSILIRIALFQAIPEEVTSKVLEQCIATQEEEAARAVASDLERTRARTIAQLEKAGASREDLERFLGHALDAYTPADEIALRGVLRSVREGLPLDELLALDSEPEPKPLEQAVHVEPARATPPAPVVPPAAPRPVTPPALPRDPNDDTAWS